ncbi:MAG: hypothetical protein A2Z64_01660 [Betaproteobacteria bacterium RIFCSPLOWO2_02_67_12]|nr:MAG: hypothetical protein A2Z64_01660 [Betaproteobacteria bacterium RIFCSPLOWO2_02_67_12]OGA27549.1 MAG: hypothetical protein A3I65_03775 [Betaproteobacteria bacterium RIFCSPLOWO2_02_FULL_68_150]OGA61166.1 MAG: hypothetical protein A3F77_10200 [Betaproteobacteria bacterium RIFCSPLOWO2_12_FULL_67_28]
MAPMRKSLALLLAAAACAAIAQTPPKLEPLPEVPPPPPGVSDPGADDPRVMIKPQEGDRVEEYRDGGRVVMLKVTPRNGPPYYLVDTTGSGNWMRRESLDDGVRVPMWTIKTFD